MFMSVLELKTSESVISLMLEKRIHMIDTEPKKGYGH